MFTFSNNNDTLNFKEVIKKVEDSIHSSFLAHVKMMEDGEGYLLPLMMTHTRFEIREELVRVYFSDRDPIDIGYDFLNVFSCVFRYYYEFHEFLFLYNKAEDGVGYTSYDFKDNMKNDQKSDHGQAKILISTLIPLCDSPRKLDILVIGSSSDAVSSGQTYDALIDYLPSLGYYGSITCVDPREKPYKGFVKGFDVAFIKDSFSWNDPYKFGRNFTHVFDDVWLLREDFVAKAVPKYSKFNVIVKEGDSKFTYYVRDNTFFFVSGLKKHSEVKNGLGGGHINRQGKKIFLYGTSNTYGPFSQKDVVLALRNYEVTVDPSLGGGRKDWDKEGNIFKYFPNSVISCKYFGEKYDYEYQIIGQTWYIGKEKRLVYGHSKIEIKKSGCGCEHCGYYQYIRDNFKSYTSGSISDIFSTIISDKCVAKKGDKVKRIMNFTKSCARSNNCTVGKVASLLNSKYRYSYNSIYRVISLMVRFNQINIKRVRVGKLADYNVRILVDNQIRFYNSLGTSYCILEGDKFYKPDEYNVLEYRPPVDYVRKEVVDYFHAMFHDIFCFIEGYESLVCTGYDTCGFDDSYDYQITKIYSRGVVVMKYKTYYLIKY